MPDSGVIAPRKRFALSEQRRPISQPGMAIAFWPSQMHAAESMIRAMPNRLATLLIFVIFLQRPLRINVSYLY
jgi:hypothetical protein